MANKRKWEVEYEKFASDDIENDIKDYEDLEKENKLTKEQYNKLKKLRAVKNNLPKVKNILELRDKLVAERKEIIAEIEKIKAEIEKRENAEKANKEPIERKNELEKERIELEKEYNELCEKLNAPDLDKKGKEKLKAKIKENQSKRQENNKKYNEMTYEKSEKESLESLEAKKQEISEKIGKCNLACNILMQGGDWKSVDLELEKFKGRKFKSSDQNKGKENREEKESIDKESEPETESSDKENEADAQEKSEETALIPVKKKGLWDKLVNFFKREKNDGKILEFKDETVEKKSLFQKLKERFSKKDVDMDIKIEDKEEDKEEEKKSKQEEFRAYLKNVAENGMDEAEKSHREDLKKRLEGYRNAEAQRMAEMHKKVEEAAKGEAAKGEDR